MRRPNAIQPLKLRLLSPNQPNLKRSKSIPINSLRNRSRSSTRFVSQMSRKSPPSMTSTLVHNSVKLKTPMQARALVKFYE